MLLWLIIILLAYLFFGIAYFGDKLVLAGPPNAKLYTFYVSMLSILVIFFIPFTPFSFPSIAALPWIVLESIAYTLGLYTMFVALEKFEVSRVMTVIGAVQPILLMMLIWIFWGAQ